MQLQLVFLGVALVCSMVTTQSAVPSIGSDGSKIQIEASDLVLTDASSAPLSLVALMAEVVQMRVDMAAMKAELDFIKGDTVNATFDAYPTFDEMSDEIDATSEAVKNELMDAQSEATDKMDARVDGILERPDIAGLPGTTQAVVELASNMKYVLAHSVNVTNCAEDGGVHAGNGKCVSPVPECPEPAGLAGGTTELSSDFIIPGVTATYSCTKDNTFLLGTKSRACSAQTKQFEGTAPRCATCAIANCDVCADSVLGAKKTCSKCDDDHDLNTDKTKCGERTSSMFVFGGRPIGSNSHNYVECEELKPNSDKWSNFPKLPNQGTHGSAYMVKGVIYHISASVRYAKDTIFSRLKVGSNSWERFPRTNGRVENNKEAPFHAAAASKLYLFGTSLSEVFDPSTNKWAVLSKLPTARSLGATAVIGSNIYCLGGQLLNRQPVATVSVFDTAKKSWENAVDMPSKLFNHAASSYGNKVVVMGGFNGYSNPSVATFILDTATGKWSTATQLPTWRADMSTGPMPMFGGKIYIPTAHQSDNHGRVGGNMLIYDVIADSWGEGPAEIRRKGQYTIVAGSRS